METKLSQRPKWFIFFEALGIILYVIIFAITLNHLLNTSSVNILVVIVSLVLGISSADIFSGLVHYFADNIGTENTTILGPALIRPFREHHIEPQKMTKHDFIETNGSLYLISSLVLFISLQFQVLIWYTFFLSLFIANTNQIHKLAHIKQENTLIRFLRRARIIISAHEHNKHHSLDLDSHYCITTGWFNKLLFSRKSN